MSDLLDYRLIGRVIERVANRHELIAGNKSALASRARRGLSPLSRTTLDRAIDGDGHTSRSTLMRIENALDLPYEALTHVGHHEWDALIEAGMDPQLIDWMRKESGNPGEMGTGIASVI